MIKIILLFFSVLCISYTKECNGQEISFSYLLSLRKKDPSKVQELLSLKGWNIVNIVMPTEKLMGNADYTRADDTSKFQDSVLLQHFWAYNTEYNQIRYHTYSIKTYGRLLSEIKKLGVTTLSSETDITGMHTYYRIKNLTVGVWVRLPINGWFSRTRYEFDIMKD